MSEISDTAFPYPLRPSEFIEQADWSVSTPEITLSAADKQELGKFERPLFERLKALRDINITGHVIYPAAFVSEKGKRLFQSTYLNSNLEEEVKEKAASLGLNWANESEKSQACEQFFDELEKGIEVEGENPRMGEMDEGNIKQLFLAADLTKIPVRILERLYDWSSRQTKEEFKKALVASGGKVDNLSNPVRVSRVVETADFKKKEKGLRSLKADIKRIKASKKRETPLQKAEDEVCNLYLQYNNILIASLYPYKMIESGVSSRSMERIDHFLAGVGLKYGENGLLQTIPENLAAYAQKRLLELSKMHDTEEIKNYDAFKVNAEQAKVLAEKVLDGYGLRAKGWHAVVLERQGGLSVNFEPQKNLREVLIPKIYKGRLTRALAVLAHEIEGHVLRYENQDESAGELSLIRELSTGRGSLLSEGAAMWMEDATRREMFGMADVAGPYYWLVLSTKAKGGTFKDCFYASLSARAKVREMTLEELMADKEKFDGVFNTAYSSTLRIFRRHTDLNDTSGYVPISSTLDYLEQELVVEFLMNQKSEDLKKLLFVAGIDLYSFASLVKIGLLDLKNVRLPSMYVARDLWPKIKACLDAGQDLETALAST